jgi:hypothetical protein
MALCTAANGSSRPLSNILKRLPVFEELGAGAPFHGQDAGSCDRTGGQKMRYAVIMLSLLFGSVIPANAQVSIGIGFPNVSIGINLPVYPQLVRVPNYPVYYAPQVGFNLFFYDGLYWVYQGDNWYASSWYNGPWGLVGPQYVPVYVLRVPVRYYRQPPPYFHGWPQDAPPRWGQHYGKHWEQERSGWDNWNRNSAPPPAPLPVYQQQYSGDRYPRVEQQPVIRSQNYRYQPSDPIVRQHYEQEAVYSKHPSKQQHPQQGAAYGQPQAPASSQQNAPQGKGATKDAKGEHGKDKGEDQGQGHDKESPQ